MRRLAMIAIMIAAPGLAHASDADGVWKTKADASGSYIEVTVAPCAGDPAKTCGMVSKAFKAGVEDPAYAYLGKPILENMSSDGGGRYSGGTVFDPENGKTYKSKMSIDGDSLDVEGCISIMCEGDVWARVK